MKLNGARIVIECLKKESVKDVFAYPGGAVIPIFDELYKNGEGINLIQPKHEQGGAHAADGYGRVSNKPGVCLVTSGPGATNTITGIATAYYDSTPMVILSGQVNASLIGTDAFQEVDISGMVATITKASFLVTDVKDIAFSLKKAFYIATTGRPGPVLVDIPVNIQKQVTEFVYPEKIDLLGYKPLTKGDMTQIAKAKELIRSAKKPLIISGGGVNLSKSNKLVNDFMDKFSIPAVCTLQGHGLCPKNEKLFVSGFGMHGAAFGNYAVQNADVLIVLGARFSDRVTGTLNTFATNAKIIQVDIDQSEIDKNIYVNTAILGDLKFVLKEFLKMEHINSDFSGWLEELQQQKDKNPLYFKDESMLKPQYLISLMNKYAKKNTVVVADVGQHQMWVSQFFRFKTGSSFISSGGLGTMGFAIPAALGVKAGCPTKNVVVVVGDGGFPMNMQELYTVVKYKLNIKILVVDNSCLGMVRQWQQLFYEERYSGTKETHYQDFVSVVEKMGINSVLLDNPENAEKLIKDFMESDSTMFVQAIVAPDEIVLPMVPSGESIDNCLS